jgi:N-acetylmuramoyl-L-alanine amidase
MSSLEKRVFIGVGHGGVDPGALGNGLRESDVNLVQAMMMMEELERHGVTVGISRTGDENDPLVEEIAEARAFNPDVAVDCHNNAGGGKGFEAFKQTGAHAAASAKLAACIEKHVIAMGQSSRGIKTRVQPNGTDYFGWLRQNPFPSVLCEGAFVDNAADAQMINTTAKQQAFGAAYAKGVLEYLGIPWQPVQDEGEAQGIIYGVMKQVIALSDPAKAQEYAAEMNRKEPGAYWFIMDKQR